MNNDLVKVYKQVLRSLDEEKELVKSDYWRLGYHLIPPVGWLNDPNGLCEFNGQYHVYYQYSPLQVEGGLKFWGHYSTKDFINWINHDVALYPDQPFDCHGVFSGSAFIEDKIYFYYTGMVKREGYSDFTIRGMEQNTVLVTSEDGINFSEKQLLLTNEEYPENMSWHVRDPKVWKKDNKYYMILGARDLNDNGCAIIYSSDDKEKWEYLNTIRHKSDLGFMWECPDYFVVDEEKVLITCPQGVGRSRELPHVHQCGYFLINGELESNNYELSKFYTLDRGFDFYAPQTFEDSKGRRLLIGWMGMSDCEFKNPTIENGWQQCLSIPREIKVVNGKLTQQPIKEIEALRNNTIDFKINNGIDLVLQGDKYELITNFEKTPEKLHITLRDNIDLIYCNEEKTFKLILGSCGYGRKSREITLEELKNLRIFSDTSSLEVFLNDGEEVFTTRVYCNKEDINIDINGLDLHGIGIFYSLHNIKIN